MKQKIYLILAAIVLQHTAHAQLSNWYGNMEKYWYYRYRLVNDFMKIGTNCGESLPASFRRAINSTENSDPNALKWDDASQQLGHYISMLSVEYQILHANGWNTRRTEEELDYAIETFNRLDQNGEGYSYAMSHGWAAADYFPCNAPSWSTTFSTVWNNGTSGPFNGYFIRDDIPFDISDVDLHNFVNWNKVHFNRPGIRQTGNAADHRANDVTFIEGAAIYDRLTTSDADWISFANGDANAPDYKYPTEGNQDQMVELFTGMGLAVRVLHNNVPTLDALAMDAAARMTTWVPKPPMPWYSEEFVIDGALHQEPSNWLYKNPLTMRCVYGSPGDLNYGSFAPWDHCGKGGANMQQVAIAVAKGMKHVCADNNGYYLAAAANLNFTGGPFNALFQALQFYPQNQTGDMQFPDNYAVFGDNWTPEPPCPWCPPVAINTTFDGIKRHANQQKFNSPHLPLMYIFNKKKPGWGPGSGLHGYNPNFHVWYEFIPSYPYVIGHHNPSYESLLNSAPRCGPYWYPAETSAGEWTGPDRLGHFFQRHQWNWNGFPEKTEFNGLDYMLLFGLYSAVMPDYLDFLINPYYMEHFDVTYPDANNSNVGSDSHKLTLNWLEYLSAHNHITSDGNVTYRGAKVLDLIPGFNSDYGSNFLGYIEDYDCHGPHGDYHFAEDNGSEFEYNMGDMSNFYPKLADTSTTASEEDMLIVSDEELTDEDAEIKFKLAMQSIARESDNPEVLDYIKSNYGINANGTWDKNNPLNQDPNRVDYNKWIELYPNPTNTTSYIEYQLFDPAKVVIRLSNTLGQDYSQLIDYYPTEINAAGKYKVMIHSEQLSAGVYYCQVSIGTQIITKKLTVY